MGENEVDFEITNQQKRQTLASTSLV